MAERAASQHAAVSAARPPRAPGTNQKCSEAPPGVARERGSGAAEAVTGAAAHRRREGEYCTSRPQHGGGEVEVAGPGWARNTIVGVGDGARPDQHTRPIILAEDDSAVTTNSNGKWFAD